MTIAQDANEPSYRKTLTELTAQDHIEPAYDDSGEMLPTVRYHEDHWKQTDIIRANLENEYAKKCFAPSIPSPLPLLVGVGIGIIFGFLIGWVL